MRSILRRVIRSPLGRLVYDGVLRLLRSLPVPSTLLGPVKGFHASFPKWLESKQCSGPIYEENRAHWILHIKSSKPLTYNPPVLAIPRTPRNFDGFSGNSYPKYYLAHLQWGRIATKQLEVISPDDHVFGDLFLGPPGRPSRARSLTLPLLPRLETKSGTYSTICTNRADNYYHWINDSLTRLWILEVSEAKDYKLIVPEGLLPFQKQTLQLLGFTPDHLAPFGNQHWALESLLIPSLTNDYWRQSSPEACRWLRKKLISTASSVEPVNSRRIYISRSVAKKRRLINENEIVSFLERFGFVSVHTEDMTVQEQINLFQKAEVVVAPHGAGLANIMFMKEGSVVLEMVHYRRAKPCFYALANALGLKYCILTDAPSLPEKEEKERPSDIDFAIPLSRLALAINDLEL